MSDCLMNTVIAILFIYIVLYLHGFDLMKNFKSMNLGCRACGRQGCSCPNCPNCPGNCACARNEGFEILQDGISDVWVQGDTAPGFPIQQNPLLQNNHQYCESLCATNWNENYILRNNISTRECIAKCLNKK